jgi:hypothetical protein
LRVLSRNGDDSVVWETEKVGVGDPESLAAVREAERIFRDQRAHGATAFRIEQGQAPVRVDEFDPAAEQIMIVPAVVGG